MAPALPRVIQGRAASNPHARTIRTIRAFLTAGRAFPLCRAMTTGPKVMREA